MSPFTAGDWLIFPRRYRALTPEDRITLCDKPGKMCLSPCFGLGECDYYALVSRIEDRPSAGVWPIRLRDRLPVIPIPLHAPDPDARLDLQQLFKQRLRGGALWNVYLRWRAGAAVDTRS